MRGQGIFQTAKQLYRHKIRFHPDRPGASSHAVQQGAELQHGVALFSLAVGIVEHDDVYPERHRPRPGRAHVGYDQDGCPPGPDEQELRTTIDDDV